MSLFEIATGAIGESYVRSYCWAPCEADARAVFQLTYPEHKIAAVVKLFDATHDILIWAPDDCGFKEEPPKVVFLDPRPSAL
jgi:hypothetical protein